MTNITTGLLACLNYAMAGLNVYFWDAGSEVSAANLGVAVFCFGIAILLSIQCRDK